MYRPLSQCIPLAAHCLRTESFEGASVLAKRCLADSGTQLRQAEEDFLQPTLTQDSPGPIRNAPGADPGARDSTRLSGLLHEYAEAMQKVLAKDTPGLRRARTPAFFVEKALRAAENGRGDCMKDVVEEMPLDGVIPTRKILRMALDAALLAQDPLEALLALAQMQRHGSRVTYDMHAAILHLAGKQSEYAFALKYSEELSNRGVYFNEQILKALLFCYGKLGKLDRAFEILDHLDSSGRSMQIESFVFAMEAAVEAVKKNPKIMDKAKATQHIEQLLERALTRLNVKYDPAERDALLSSTMAAYKAFGNYAAAKDAYAHIANKTPKRRSQYMLCLVQDAVDRLSETSGQETGMFEEAVQDCIEAFSQALEELKKLSGADDRCMDVDDACRIMEGASRFEACIKDEKSQLEDMTIDLGLPMELADRLLSHLDFAGLVLPQKAGNRIVLATLSSGSDRQFALAKRVLSSMRRYSIEPNEEALRLLQQLELI